MATDGYTYPYRDVSDQVHFREDRSSGVSTLGGLWVSSVNNASSAPIGSITPPVITMSKSGSAWTLTSLGTYSEYRWINMATANPNSAVGTSFSYSGSTGGSYAVLVKNSSGRWAISQTIYTNCGSCREGVLTDWSEADERIQTKAYPVPFDKQVTIEFSIPYDSRVRLEIINEKGITIKQLTDNMQAKGAYSYPVSLEDPNPGLLFYRLNVNGLGITKKLIKLH
ncbi:hypothetical protein GO730_02670 [Spirosoma sp. HMF3257]|uniref:T9SS type A sorting domain-containing protein n=1 Tax=Spirosoma telluris TaxID=2183553 RepID=A0A327NE67_9BACT|nr:hypothetical protein [Spirosoma telluris]RAI73590.1 hypothetical protein HMF3257_02605 [Spirosoma telluris]